MTKKQRQEQKPPATATTKRAAANPGPFLAAPSSSVPRKKAPETQSSSTSPDADKKGILSPFAAGDWSRVPGDIKDAVLKGGATPWTVCLVAPLVLGS